MIQCQGTLRLLYTLSLFNIVWSARTLTVCKWILCSTPPHTHTHTRQHPGHNTSSTMTLTNGPATDRSRLLHQHHSSVMEAIHPLSQASLLLGQDSLAPGYTKNNTHHPTHPPQGSAYDAWTKLTHIFSSLLSVDPVATPDEGAFALTLHRRTPICSHGVANLHCLDHASGEGPLCTHGHYVFTHTRSPVN